MAEQDTGQDGQYFHPDGAFSSPMTINPQSVAEILSAVERINYGDNARRVTPEAIADPGKLVHPETAHGFELASKAAAAAPIIASEALSQEDKTIYPLTLGHREVYEIYPVVEGISKFLHAVWNPLGNLFDKVVDRFTSPFTSNLHYLGLSIWKLTERFKKSKNPREDFVNELKNLYEIMNGEHEVNKSPKKNVAKIIRDFARIRLNPQNVINSRTRENFPILSEILPYFLSPTGKVFKGKNSIPQATPEILRGLHAFLLKQGINNLPPISEVQEDWIRRLIMRIPAIQGKLERVETELPNILEAIYELTPSNGKEFEEALMGLARTIYQRKTNGIKGIQIFDGLNPFRRH